MLPPGWSGWIAREAFPMKGDAKSARPWSRLRPDAHRRVVWVPRSSKVPRELRRWAVESPAREIPGFDVPGWFIVSWYVRTEATLEPEGRCCGVLPPPRVAALLQKLEDYYWDPERG